MSFPIVRRLTERQIKWSVIKCIIERLLNYSELFRKHLEKSETTRFFLEIPLRILRNVLRDNRQIIIVHNRPSYYVNEFFD